MVYLSGRLWHLLRPWNDAGTQCKKTTTQAFREYFFTFTKQMWTCEISLFLVKLWRAKKKRRRGGGCGTRRSGAVSLCVFSWTWTIARAGWINKVALCWTEYKCLNEKYEANKIKIWFTGDGWYHHFSREGFSDFSPSWIHNSNSTESIKRNPT